ncbi:MAG: pyridoxal-dependent decarboxylase [bacterium]
MEGNVKFGRFDHFNIIGAAASEINYCDNGLELTRRFRALKLWMSFKIFGLAAFRAAIERGTRLAEIAGELLRAAGCWKITSPAQLAVITFRHRNTPADPEAAEDSHRRLLAAVVADGHSLVTGTALNGRPVLRLCTVNPRTTDADLRETLTRLRQLAESL